MVKEEDDLLRIRRKKPQELMSRGKMPEHKESFLNKPVIVTDATLPEMVQKYPLVVVDCWAPWCAPCHIVAPVIEELAKDYNGKIVFGKLNIDENQRIAMKYGIMSIPTLLIFKNGKLVDAPIGAMPREMLEPIITKHLRKI